MPSAENILGRASASWSSGLTARAGASSHIFVRTFNARAFATPERIAPNQQLKYRPVLGSNIPQLFRVFTVVFSSEIGGNHVNANPGSHMKPGLTADDTKAHGKTEATPWVRQLGGSKLEAHLKVDCWLHPDAVAKFGYANLARLEREHTYGSETGGYKTKSLIEKGGFWDQERGRIQSLNVFSFRDSDYAAQKLTNQIGRDLQEYQRYQKQEMDNQRGAGLTPEKWT